MELWGRQDDGANDDSVGYDDVMDLDEPVDRSITPPPPLPSTRPFIRQTEMKRNNNAKRPNDLLEEENQPRAKVPLLDEARVVNTNGWERELKDYEIAEIFVNYLPITKHMNEFISCLTHSARTRILTKRSQYHKCTVILCPQLIKLTGIISLTCTYPLMTWIREIAAFAYCLHGEQVMDILQDEEDKEAQLPVQPHDMAKLPLLAQYIKWLVSQSAYHRLFYMYYAFYRDAASDPPGSSFEEHFSPHSDVCRRSVLDKVGAYIAAIDNGETENIYDSLFHDIRLCYEAARTCIDPCPTARWWPKPVRDIIDCMTIGQYEEDVAAVEASADYVLLLGDYKVERYAE